MSSIDGVLSGSPPGGSPIRRRDSSSITDGELSRPRLSPTLVRSFDPNDPQVRERQRTMDVDMAMQLSRARRETLKISPTASPTEEDPDFGLITTLSPHEQHEIEIARGTTHQENGDEEEGLQHHHENDLASQMKRQPSIVDLRGHINQMQDPSLLAGTEGPRFTTHDDPSSSNFGQLPTYQATNISRSNFDFSPMEDFAAAEKATLGLSSPRFSIPTPRAHSPTPPDQPADGPSDSTPTLVRMARQRKLSQSNTAHPRVHRKGIGGKLALFEGHSGAPPPSLPGRLFGLPTPSGAVHSSDDIPALQGAPSGLPSGLGGILNPTGTGHDRPYRFSFYSNALSATIHARSLSELPAEGQTFEDLFTPGGPSRSGSGMGNGGGGTGDAKTRPTSSLFSTSEALKRSGSPQPPMGKGAAGPGARGFMDNMPMIQRSRLTGGMVGGGDAEGSTWWLDVQSPTDEEMKMLSKVFSIHPLTTEDIQMEEIREKIELFRNYYLVCFRSFDQDPYSPTHLEPLNMYIIVFREGTLSFHFRPTPHPQNVRRRIKQLKDYISVTSDWISYALIDDITDAFGPLIQSIEYEVDSIDELVLILNKPSSADPKEIAGFFGAEAERSDMLRRIGRCRKKVMGLLRLMGNKADVVKGLAKRCNENWQVAPTSDIGLYLSDIQDHLITMTQNLNHYEKILSRSHSNYLAQISIEMTDANNQINDVLSKLTALGTVLIPMNLVTGLWGMNVHVPGENTDGLKWFASIVACLAAFAFLGGYSTYKFMVRRSS